MPDVTLTIDGQQVVVPAGTGLVEAAAELGVEIPVFCYEPRIGPAVGACRMCLVEIEGVPKLQAACATPVRDGMVVSTVSDRARDAQEAVLEFLLVNHPLDCPVCDKGGECPLQDHAFRWGPGSTRFSEAKRVGDKPIPVSPLIALDRERCILCYRCTRYSAGVTEDLQLIPRQRGASSVIATFEGRPWEGHHAGNVIELCPVGALTSTQYRFQARPWEAPDHPSIAPWDPVGTNVFNTVREGRVVRVLSRRNDDVDHGWIDDRTRFAYASMNGPSRITAAQERPYRDRPMGNRPVVEASFEVALEWLHDKLSAGDDTLWVLSGNETLETAWAAQQVVAQAGGRVVAAPLASAAAPLGSARIADLVGARNIIVIGHADLLDTAPALDLWLRRARKGGARITVVGMGGTRIEGDGIELVHVGPDGLESFVAQLTASPAATLAEDPTVVIYRDGDLSQAAIEQLTSALALPRDGSGLLAISHASNARGLAALGIESLSMEEILAHRGGLVLHGVDPDRWVDAAQWGPALKQAAWVAAIDALPAAVHGAVDLVIPGSWAAEQEGTLVNLEGRLQRLTVGASAPDGVRAPLRWIAGLARRMGGNVPGHAAGAFRQLAEASGGALPVASHGDIPAGGQLGVVGGPVPGEPRPAGIEPAAGELGLYVAPCLYDAPEVAHTEAMQFLRSRTVLHLNRDDARARGLHRGAGAVVRFDGQEVCVEVATSRRIAPGHARIHAGRPGLVPGRTGWHVAELITQAPAGAVAAATAAQDGDS